MARALSDRFVIKPAPLAATRVYRMADGVLFCDRESGAPDWQVDLARVERAAFVTHRVRGLSLWRLDLVADGTRHSISQTLGAAETGPDRAVFVALLAAVCAGLDATQPGKTVTLGEYGRWRLVWFGLGVVSLLFGMGIPIAALIDGVSIGRLLGAAIGLLALTGLGLMLIRVYAPWRNPPTVGAGDFARQLTASPDAAD